MALGRWSWSQLPGGTPWTRALIGLNTGLKRLENFLAGMLGHTLGRKAAGDGDTSILVTNTAIILTGNTTATTVAGFTGGEPGQSVIVLAGDNNTTFQHSGILRLDGNADWVAYRGESRQFFTYDGSTWYEVPRGLSAGDEEWIGTEALDELLTEAGDYLGIE